VEQAQERKWEQERSNFPLEIIFLTPRSNEDASKQATDRGRGKLRRRHGRQELRPRDLATRPPHAYFIDAKSSETWRQTGNHALERNALAAALNWTAIWEMDVWYIFTDGSGTTARQLAKPSAKWPGPQRGNGSGTPFWLFPVGLTTPWEQLTFTNSPSKPKLCPSPDLGTQIPANFCLRHPTAN
jgi:hypothetical protein